MSVEILFEDPRWEAAALEEIAGAACAAALAHLGLDPEDCEISLLACDDARIAGLNAEFRAKPAATNVLSWPAEDLAPEADGDAPARPGPGFGGGPAELGEGKKFNDHVTHLVVHGCLHLLGHDHVRPRDAARMERLEAEILAKLGVADPYG
jgi:probable rRNA maturation factor